MRTALKHDLRSAPRRCASRRCPRRRRSSLSERLQARQQQGLCFAAVSLGFHGRLGGVDEGCTPGVPNVRTPLEGGIGEGDRAGGTIFAAVVPDVVGSVTLDFYAGGGNPARSITSRAVNNVVVFKIPPHTAHRQFPSRVIVRDRHGHPISMLRRLLLKRRAMHTPRRLRKRTKRSSALDLIVAWYRSSRSCVDRPRLPTNRGRFEGRSGHTHRSAIRPIRWPRTARREDLPLPSQRHPGPRKYSSPGW